MRSGPPCKAKRVCSRRESPLPTLHDIVERARAAQQRIPPGESAWLLAAAVRIAAVRNATLRTRLVQLDANGNMSVLPFTEAKTEEPALPATGGGRRPEHTDDETGFLAPELFAPGAPAKDEPRVQVYAAGAFGYELLTGQPPPDPRVGPGRELTGPLGDVLRLAMAKDRRERFANLEELRQAIDAVQRNVGADKERLAFAALAARSEKWVVIPDLDRAAIGKLIEQVAQLSRQMEAVRSGMAEVQREQREVDARVVAIDSRVAAADTAPVKASSRASRALLVSAIVGGIAGAIIAIVALSVLARTPVVRSPDAQTHTEAR